MMSQNKSVNPKMYKTDAASLCTLCVLETQANVFENFSSSLSPDIQTFSSFYIPKKLSTFPPSRSNIIENKVTAGINYLPSYREISNKIEEIVKLDKRVIDATKIQLEKNNKFQWKPTNRPDLHKNESKYPEKSVEQSTILSFSGISRSISLEIGILPELSPTIIDRVLALVDKNFIANEQKIGIPREFVESSEDQPQAPILETSLRAICEVPNPQKVISTVNPFLQPSELRLKRDKKNVTTELSAEVPKKKPKIVNQEVLQFPIFRFPLDQDPAMRNPKENPSKNDWRVVTKGFPEATIVLGTPTEMREPAGCTLRVNGPGEEMQKVEKERMAAEKPDRPNGRETAEKIKNPRERESPFLPKRFPLKYSDLLMLQRKITENSQSLMKQAEEMKRLSGFIDELKESLTSEETDAASRRERAKEFVSKSTQTIDRHPSEISPDDPISRFPPFANVQRSNVKASQGNDNSRETERSETETFHRKCSPPVTSKYNKDSMVQAVLGAQKTVPNPPWQRDCPEKMAVEKSFDKKLFSVVENPGISNTAAQYDPYYNPLRPRRWPRNRNNPSKFGVGKQCHGKNSYFPPLPIVIENRRSTNSNK